jgi:pimeloyl-ACP methyl ester carboxylesterase
MKWHGKPRRCARRVIERSSIVLTAVLAAATALEAQDLVSFPTSDGGVVYADDYGAGERAVVLAHGGRFTKESWAEQAESLMTEGFRVLAIDFRGRGMSHGGPGSDGDDVHLDVLAAVQYLRNTGAQTISLVGASFGGWAVARAATELTAGEIDAVVLLAHSPIENPEAIHGRKLFVTTRGDFSGGGRLRLPDIREQYERASEPKRLVILEGSAHAQNIFDTEQGPRLLREIVQFLLDGKASPES